MYDVNPLGLMMHLRELERQAAPKLRSLRPREQDASSHAAIGTATILLLRRLRPTAILKIVTATLRRLGRQPPVTDRPRPFG
jgi:hypothetical protein